MMKIKYNSDMSVIRRKGESQNGGNKKTKYAKFFEKANISYPLIRTIFPYVSLASHRFIKKYLPLYAFLSLSRMHRYFIYEDELS